MMNRPLASFMVCILLIVGHYAEGQKKNDFTDLHLKGRIKTLKESFFSASDSSGTVVRNKEILYSYAPVRSFRFNDAGLLEEKTESDSDSTYVKHLYQYNEQGNKTEDVVWNPDGTIREVTLFSYDDKGKLEKCENKQVSKSEKLLRKEDYMKVRGPYRKRIYTYDEKGNTTCETTYDSRGFSSVVYTCDGKGNITGHKYVNEEGKTEKSLIFTFDTRGNPMECRQFDAEGKLQSRIVYKYDINNVLTEETEFAPDGSIRNTIGYAYEYDGHTNWVRQIAYQNKVPVRMGVREIGYYE